MHVKHVSQLVRSLFASSYIFHIGPRELGARVIFAIFVQKMTNSMLPILEIRHPLQITCPIIKFIAIYMVYLRLVFRIRNVFLSNQSMYKVLLFTKKKS